MMNPRKLFPLLAVVAIAVALHASTIAAQDKPETITNSLGMKLVRIPAGGYLMGSPPDEAEREAEELQHVVVISKPFWMGAHEVTQEQFFRVFQGDRKPRVAFDKQRGGGPEHPMENVRWENAGLFCKQLSALPAEREAGRTYRLPTEAEWEYACRAGTGTPFHYGASLSSKQANFNGNYPYGDAAKGPYLRRTAKVGSYEPNAWGLYDMHGNVSEWCRDWYDPEYYPKSPPQDPPGPPTGVLSDGFGQFYLTIRGGSWVDDGRACRSAYRYRAMTRTPNQLVGFRVVCEVADQDSE